MKIENILTINYINDGQKTVPLFYILKIENDDRVHSVGVEDILVNKVENCSASYDTFNYNGKQEHILTLEIDGKSAEEVYPNVEKKVYSVLPDKISPKLKTLVETFINGFKVEYLSPTNRERYRASNLPTITMDMVEQIFSNLKAQQIDTVNSTSEEIASSLLTITDNLLLSAQAQEPKSVQEQEPVQAQDQVQEPQVQGQSQDQVQEQSQEPVQEQQTSEQVQTQEPIQTQSQEQANQTAQENSQGNSLEQLQEFLASDKAFENLKCVTSENISIQFTGENFIKSKFLTQFEDYVAYDLLYEYYENTDLIQPDMKDKLAYLFGSSGITDVKKLIAGLLALDDNILELLFDSVFVNPQTNQVIPYDQLPNIVDNKLLCFYLLETLYEYKNLKDKEQKILDFIKQFVNGGYFPKTYTMLDDDDDEGDLVSALPEDQECRKSLNFLYAQIQRHYLGSNKIFENISKLFASKYKLNLDYYGEIFEINDFNLVYDINNHKFYSDDTELSELILGKMNMTEESVQKAFTLFTQARSLEVWNSLSNQEKIEILSKPKITKRYGDMTYEIDSVDCFSYEVLNNFLTSKNVQRGQDFDIFAVGKKLISELIYETDKNPSENTDLYNLINLVGGDKLSSRLILEFTDIYYDEIEPDAVEHTKERRLNSYVSYNDILDSYLKSINMELKSFVRGYAPLVKVNDTEYEFDNSIVFRIKETGLLMIAGFTVQNLTDKKYYFIPSIGNKFFKYVTSNKVKLNFDKQTPTTPADYQPYSVTEITEDCKMFTQLKNIVLNFTKEKSIMNVYTDSPSKFNLMTILSFLNNTSDKYHNISLPEWVKDDKNDINKYIKEFAEGTLLSKSS